MKRLVTLFAATILSAQTRVDPAQIRNLMVSPIQSMDRRKCVGSGVNEDGTRWDCNGLILLTITLAGGRTLGPYVVLSATPEIVASPNWQPMTLDEPEPTIP